MLSLAVSSGLAYQAPSGLLRKPRSTPTKLQAVEGVVDAEAMPPPPLPIIETITVGGKQLAGDAGFDPLQLSDSPKSLAWYREAEVKHARLAMLAAAGWPLAEKLNFGGLLTSDGRAPSLLNGGLDQVSTVYWLAALGLAVFVESKTIDSQLGTGKRADDYLPGMLNFDPLGMDSDMMRNAEITNGRVAMLAITAFALEEAIFKAPVTAETSVFFQPIWTTLGL